LVLGKAVYTALNFPVIGWVSLLAKQNDGNRTQWPRAEFLYLIGSVLGSAYFVILYVYRYDFAYFPRIWRTGFGERSEGNST